MKKAENDLTSLQKNICYVEKQVELVETSLGRLRTVENGSNGFKWLKNQFKIGGNDDKQNIEYMKKGKRVKEKGSCRLQHRCRRRTEIVVI